MRGLPSKVLADRLEQIEKKKKEEEKTKRASKKTSTEEARHKNSSSSKNSGSKAKIRGVQSPRKDSEKDDSLKEHRTALSQRNNKPLYSYRGNAVYTPAIKGAQVLNADDPRNDATYLARGVGLGMGSLVSDWNKDRKANMERYNAGVNKSIGRVTPTMQSAQNAGAVKKYDLEGGVVNDAARKFENFYNRESEKYWSDPRSQELGSKLAYGGGRLAADLGLMALPGISGEIRTGARVADKALNFLTNPVRNPWSLMSNVSAYRGNRYDEARKAGADVTTAAKAADTYAAVQAYTQALGGAERAFNNPSTASTLKRIVSAGAQEAVEEPLQMPWENWSKTLYGKNVPLYAEGKDENGNYREAVINPDAMKEAALLGGILGAAGGAVGAVRNPSAGRSGGTLANQLESKYNNINDTRGGDNDADHLTGTLARNDRSSKNGMDEYQYWQDGNADELGADDGRSDVGLAGTQYGENQHSMGLRGDRSQSTDGSHREGYRPNLSSDVNTKNTHATERGFSYADLQEVANDEISRYSAALEESKASSELGGMVDSQSSDDLVGARAFLSTNGMAGFAVQDDGNIVGVFNNRKNPVRGVTPVLIKTAIENGGTHLDCYAQYLPNGNYAPHNLVNLYARSGMIPVAWMEFDVENFDIPGGNPYAPPDVVFMAVGDGSQPRFWSAEEVHRLPKFSDYEAAQKYAASIGNQNGRRDNGFIYPEDRDGTLDRGHAQTAFTREVEQNNDEMAQTILNEAERDNSPLRRGVYTDNQAQRNVWAELEGKSIEQAASEFIAESAAVSGNTPRLKDLVTKGLEVYVQAVNDGDIELATRMLAANSVLGTELGRGVQAYSQLRKLTPEGRLVHLNAAVRQQARKNTGYDGVEVREKAEDAVAQELPRIIDDFANDAPMEESSDNYENATIAKKVDELRKKAGTEDKYVYRRGTKKGKGNDKTHIVTAKKIIAEGLKANEIDLTKAIRNGDADEVTATLVEYAESRFDDKLSSDKLLDLTVEIHEEICERVRKYRDGVFKNLAGKEFKGKGQKFIQKLREFNNMGAFDDPETGRLVYDHLGVPVMQEDVAEMILDLSYLSKEISDNPNAPIESDFLTDEEIDALEAARDKHGADYVVGAIERKAEETALDLVKSTGWQKVRQYQLTSMLLNLKTMLRNVTPNIGMAGMNVVGDLGATVLDKQLAKKTGYRTKGAPNIKTAIKGAKKGASEALTDYKLGVDTSQGNTIELSKRRHFEGANWASRKMNRATDLMGLGLQLGDRPFENAYRNISLENQMKLNNLDEPTALMKELADIEAMERTFKDDNELTKGIQGLVSGLNKISTLGKSTEFGLGSMVVPFVRTPVNLTKTVFQYSPAGAVNVAVDAWNYKNAVNEEAKIKAQHKLVNDFSKLISGVILGAMVIALKESDLVEIYGGEDDEESYDRRNYNKQVHGFQPYSIRIGDKYYNYGNLQPIGSIMAMTVDSWNALADGEKDGDFLANLAEGTVNAFISSGDLLYEQSFLKSFANLFNSNEEFPSALAETIMTFPSQFNPAILQQFARVLDPHKRNTQGDNIFAEGFNKFVNNVPFASKTLPEQVDAYGNAVERFDGGTVSDVFNAFANPITVTKHKETAVTNEIERLEAITGESLIPKTVGTSIEFGDKNIRLTGDEQSELNKKIGSDTNSALSELFASEGYASLSETDKAKAAMNVRDSIANAYKAEFLNSKGYAKTVTKKQQAMIDAPNHGLSVAEFAVHDAMISSFDDMEFADDLAKSSAKRIYILNSDLGSEGAVYMIQSEGLFDSENHNINMTNAKNADNISNEDYILAYTAAKAYESIDDNYDKRLADTISFISGMKHLDSDQQKSLFNYVFNRYKMTYDDSDIDFSSGDVTTILMGVQGKKFQEVWNGNNKYINYDIKSLGYESSDWLAMYNWANANAEGTSKAAYEAAVDKIDAPADVKRALVAMRNFKPSGGYSDGGSVSLEEINESYSAEVTPWDDVVSTVNAAKPAGTYNLATPEEKARRDARKSLDEWGGASKIVNPVGYDGQYVTGEYGEDRGDHTHAGIDIGVDRKDGISAHSVMSGEVVSVGSKGGYGNTVIIKNDDGYYCLYGHLASYADLKAGDRVTAGQQIGVVGSTGRSSGNHLHFEVRSGSASGNAVDPNSVYDIDGDGVLTNGNSQSLGTGTADPNYSGKSSTSSGSSSSSSSSGSSGSSGGRSGTLARSISSKKRYGYTPGSTSFNFGGNTSRRWVQ